MSDAVVEELRGRIARGTAVVVAGAGVAIQTSGGQPFSYPRQAFSHRIERVQQLYVQTGRSLDQVDRLKARAETAPLDALLEIADELTRLLEADGLRDELAGWLRETAGALRVADDRLIKALGSLRAPIATANYDALLERVLGLATVTWREPKGALAALGGRRRNSAVVHLHGHWKDPASVLFGLDSYNKALTEPTARTVMSALAAKPACLFVGFGAGLGDPYFRGLRSEVGRRRLAAGERLHVLLATEPELAEFQERYRDEGVVVVPYGPDYGALAPFLRGLEPAGASTGEQTAAPIQRALEGLPERERQVLILRFGLDSGTPRTQEQVGRAMGLSRYGVGKVERQARTALYAEGRAERLLEAVDAVLTRQPDNKGVRQLKDWIRRDSVGVRQPPRAAEPAAEELLEPLGGGYDADDAEDPNRRDALGFKGDANMLCAVLADKHATPPLSVGLFGEWGSGKSFYMGLMRRRIEALAAAAYQAEQAGKDTCYCSRVVQITFNAWHYMDANLWASLAVEIFNRLATPPPPGRPAPTAVEAERERVERERRRVLQRLDTYQRLVAELAENHQRAEQERSRVAQELAAASRQRQSVARRLAAVVSGDITAALDEDRQLTALRTQAATALGLPEVPSAELPTLVSDLRKVSGQAGLIWRLLARRKGRWTFALAAAFIIALLVGVVLLAVRGGRGLGAGSIAVSLAAMAGLAARVGPVVGAVHRGLGLAEGALRYADSLERRIREQRTARQVELEAELRGLVAQEQGLATQLADATAKAAEARAEEEDLRDGRRLRRFLQERSGSADYRRHLGLISLLHQDFQQLSVLLQLAQQAREQAEASEEDDEEQLPRIDRIILYIDDLDRCPPARVVEVLQAMHLLLALPLFVVVVGVDPRWLLRSLQRHYRALLTSPGAERAAPGDVSHWASTPQNYLEKIFQIPFALAPMTKAGFQRLVTDLATSTRRPTSADRQADAAEDAPPPAPQTPSTSDQPEPPSSAPQAASATSDVDAATTLQAEDTTSTQRAGATVGPGDGGSRPSTSDPQLAERQQILVEEGSAASVEHDVDPNPRGLTLTDAEIDFIQALAPMVATPRAGKRLVNIYRMIRSTQAIGGGSQFLRRDQSHGGEYQVVLQLLAAVSGMPHLAGPTFTALLQADRDGSWRAFVDRLLPAHDPPHGNAIHPRLDNTQATEWRRLHAGLATLRDEVPVPDELGPYQEWAPRIARFSFASGRLLGDTLTAPPSLTPDSGLRRQA
jgi:hypothetical protein